MCRLTEIGNSIEFRMRVSFSLSVLCVCACVCLVYLSILKNLLQKPNFGKSALK